MIRSRADYMANRCTHQEYYAQIAKECGVSFAKSTMLREIKDALSHGDEHLNEIDLDRWDQLGWYIAGKKQTKQAFEKRGDFVSQAGLVCLLKAAAKEAAR